MERGGSRLLIFLGLIGLLFFFWGQFGSDDKVTQPIVRRDLVVPEGSRPPERLCDIWTDEFRAQVSSRGAVVKHFELLTSKYQKEGVPTELATTPDHPHLSPLYVSFRNQAKPPGEDWLVSTDIHDWKIVENTGKKCVLEYSSNLVRLTKTIQADKGPYELSMTTSVENLSDEPLPYAMATGTSSFQRDEDVESHMFRMNPLHSHVECISADGEAERMRVEDFEPEDFEDKELFPTNDLNAGDWFETTKPASISAVSSAYLTNAVSTQSGPVAPVCQLQIEERWDSANYSNKGADPNSAAIYKARLAYPKRVLAPGKTETYEVHAYIGPKERNALQAAGANFDQLIDLGFFSWIAKVLVAFLLKVYSVVPNWGVAIIILTITARVLLFPLTVPSIKNMIHMRELKPEMDALNEKYKDDPQAKGLAQMELWKKHKVNPMKGCLPQLVSMPVWFALYTTLQTAVELYNIPFLWFPDLSEPDPYYILPFIIGGVFFLQQKLMPMQMDPAQQKMMMYFMPGMFTVFMLFLPAGLGVYMFTNSVLGIVQQQLVERHVRHTMSERREATGAPEEIPASSPVSKRKKARNKRRA